MKKKLTVKRELEVGDIIVAKGGKATISSIISQDTYFGSNYCDDSVNIEFRDSNGNYRSWKSDIDGGYVLYKEDIVPSSLRKYYDPYCGRYGIPVKEVNSDISEDIVKLLNIGFCMSMYSNGGEDYYVIFNIKEDCKSYSDIDKCKGLLESLLSKLHMSYFTSVSIEGYTLSYNYQRAVDYVLKESFNVERYSIVLICKDDRFKFIEVLDACI